MEFTLLVAVGDTDVEAEADAFTLRDAVGLGLSDVDGVADDAFEGDIEGVVVLLT